MNSKAKGVTLMMEILTVISITVTLISIVVTIKNKKK